MYPKTVLLIAALALMTCALPVEGLEERQLITQQAACCRDHIVLQDARSIGFDCIRPPNPAMGKLHTSLLNFQCQKLTHCPGCAGAGGRDHAIVCRGVFIRLLFSSGLSGLLAEC